jgi:beta-lactamase superfamily II metal-dependent hydrolase
VDIVVLSHPHPDHFGGLASALPELDVGEFWDTGQGELEGAGPVYERMLRGLRRRGVDIVRPGELCHRPRYFGGATLEVLAPCPRFVSGRNANDNSIVLRIAYGKTSVLLTGDAEAEQERELVQSYGSRLRSQLLKAGHHGSRTSSNAEFLHWVKPQLGTVSCGTRNRFGHPHADALERLKAAGALPLRIDRIGSVIWQSDGAKLSVRAYGYPLESLRRADRDR